MIKSFLQPNRSIKKWIILLSIFLLIQKSYAQVNWDGGAGTNSWSDAANWLPDGVPLAGDDVLIGSGYIVTVDANQSCNSLTLESNTVNTLLTINSGITLTVTGSVTFTAPAAANINQTLDIADGTLTCVGLTMPNTGYNDRDDYLYLNDGTLNVSGTLRMYGNGNRNRVQVFGSGVINLTGDFRGGTFSRGNSTVNYNGTGDQQIGNYYYNNISVSNGGVKTLLNTTLVYGILTLDNVINLDNRQLRITTSGSITTSGGYNNLRMLDFQNGGILRRDGNSSALYQMIYPVGFGSDYSPFEISNITGTIGGGNIQIICYNEKHTLTQGSDNVITKYWDILTTNITVTNIQGTFTYNDTDAAVPITETNLTMVGRLAGAGWQTNEAGTGYDHGNNQIVLNGAVPDIAGTWTLGENTGCFDGTLPDKFTVRNGNWGTASTWNNSVIPGASDNVAILHAVTLNVDASISSLEITEPGSLNLYTRTLSVTNSTIVDGIMTDNNNGGTNTFSGNFRVNSGGSFTTNNRSPHIFEGGITNNGTFQITNGSANISFNTNSQLIDGVASPLINGTITVGSGVSVTNRNTESSTGLQINGTMNGADGTSSLINETILTIGGTNGPMRTTGVLDASYTDNLIQYISNGTQYITDISYENLTCSSTNWANKTLAGNTAVNDDFILELTTDLYPVGYNLTVNDTAFISGRIYDDNAAGIINFEEVDLSSGQITGNTSGVVNINGNLFLSSADGYIGACDLTVLGTTVINSGVNLNFNSATGTKIFSDKVSITDPAGGWVNTSNESIEFQNGLEYNGSTFTSGGGTYSFTTNNQSITGSAPIVFSGYVSVGAGIILSNQNTDITTGVIIVNDLIGTDASSTFENRGILTYQDYSIPMAVGVLDAASYSNTFNYNRNNTQLVKATEYDNLVFSNVGSKYLQDSTVVNIDFTTSGTANTICNANDLTFSGTVNYTSTGTFTTGNNEVSYNSSGDQDIITANYSGILNTAGSGNKNLLGDISVTGDIFTGGTSFFDLSGRTLTSSGNITVQSNSTLEVDAGAQLLMANTRTINNNGILRVIGAAGNEALVGRNGAAGGYSILQSGASAEFHARYYQFDNISGGINISAGQFDNTNNFSDGSFTNGSGSEYINITGLDITGLPDVNNVVFESGPSYNVSRTSGTGNISFVDASGALAGENYDNDDGNPGTLITWSYPSSVYYSTGNVSAGLTSSWTRNPDGTGGNPSSVTDGLNTLIVQDGHTVVLDNSGDVDVLALQIGEGASGIFRIGADATQRTVTIQELLDVKSGGSLSVGSSGSPAHILKLYGNLNNDGIINLRATASDFANMEIFGISSVIQGTAIPILNDITFKTGCIASSDITLDINGNVFIEASAQFDDGGQTHSIAGNWSVTGNGAYLATGTINFDGLVNTVQDNPSGTLVSFFNITFSGGGAGSVQENMLVTGEAYITNSTILSIPNVRISVEGDFTLDPGATYTQSANTTQFTGTNIQNIDLLGTVSFYYLEFLNGAVNAKIVTGDIVTTNRLTIYSGATVSGNGNHTIAGGLRIDGTCNFSGSVTMTSNYLITYDPGNTLTLGTAELIIDGYVGLYYAGAATSLIANVNNNVTVLNGYLIINNNTQLPGQAGNTFRLDPNRNLYCRGTDNFPTGFGSYELEVGSMVIYDAAFDQIVRGNITYEELRLGGASGFTKTVDGPLDINAYLDLNDAVILDLQTYSHTIAGRIYNSTNSTISGANASLTLDAEDADQIVEASGTGNYTLNNFYITLNAASASRTKTFYSGSTISISGGNFSVANSGGSGAIKLIVDLRDNGISGTPNDLILGEYCQLNTTLPDFGALVTDNFSGSKTLDVNSTVYYSLNGAQTIADGFTYGNLTFNGGDKTARGVLDINGSISRTANTPVFYDAGLNHTLAGDWLLNSTNYYTQTSATGTITFDGVNQDINGYNFNHVIISNTGLVSVASNLNIYGDITVNPGASIDFSTRSMNLRGSYQVIGNGLFTQSTGTSTFSSINNQTITSNSTSYLGHFLINKPNPAGSQTVSVLSEFHIGGNTTLSIDAGVLDITGQDVYFGSRLYVETNVVEAGPTFIATGSNSIFDGSDAQYIRNYHILPLTFNNIQFEGAGDKTIDIGVTGSRNMMVDGDFTIDGSTVSASGWGYGGMDIFVKGDWDNSGTFQHNNARTVYFDGTDQTISSSGFWNLDIGGTNTKTLLGNISVYSNLIISVATLNANNNNITVDGNWSNIVPAASFIPGTGKVVFNGGYAQIFTGAETGPIAGKGFYNVEINKNATTATLRGHLDVNNALLLTSGNLVTDTNSIWLAGDFIRTGGDLNQNNNASKLRLDATSGIKDFDPQGETLRGVVVEAPGAEYSVQSDFIIVGTVDMIIDDGEFRLNGNKLTINSNNLSIELNGGTLNVDTASIIEFNANNQELNVNGGTLMLVGSTAQPASLIRNTGRFSVNVNSGIIHIYDYVVRNGNITFNGGSLDGTHNFSNGTFADGGGNAYLTLTGFDFADFSVDNVVFNSGPTYNVSRTSGTGVITFQDASGGLAGENYDQDDADPGTLVEWSFPAGFFWDGGAGTEDWHDADNWSGNIVPTINDIAYLNHDYVSTPYNIRIMSDNAIAKRVITDDQGGNTIDLFVENGYDLTLDEHLVIGNNTTLNVTNTLSELFIGMNWTNLGTFNHGNSKVNFNGPAGNYTIATGGSGSGKSFYNITIDAEDAIYGLNDPGDFDNDLTVSDGTFSLLSGANDITVGGDWLIDQMNGGAFICSTADVNFDGTDQSITNGTFYNFLTTGSGTKTLFSNIDINNTLTIGTSTTFNGQTYNIYLGNDWYNNGSFAQSGLGTVIFDGTTGQIIDGGTSITSFNNLSFSNNGGKIFYASSLVNGSMTINGGSGAVNVDTYVITGVGGSNVLTSFGTLEIRGLSNFPQGFETINLASNSMVDYRSDIDQDIFPTQYGNLRFRSLTGANTLKTALGDFDITGSLYMNTDAVTSFDANANDVYIKLTGTIAFNAGCDIIWGTGNSTLEHVGANWYIDADIDSLNHVILSGTGDKYMQGDLLIGGDVTVKSSIDLRMYQTTGIAFYHRMIGIPSRTFTLENGARLINSTPAAIAPAIPEGFGTYNIDDNSTVYLYSPTGIDQTMYTGNSISYGNLYFVYAKTVTSDGVADLDVNGDFDINDAIYQDNNRNMKFGGANIYLTYYVPSSSTITITLDGLQNQYIRDDRENVILIPSIVFAGNGIKTYGDGNDVVTIDGNLTVNPGVTATSARNITFNGTTWDNNGIYTQSGNTINFNGATDQTINSGASNPSNYFRNLQFSTVSTKTFISNGADINGTFTINAGTVDMGTQTHSLTGHLTNNAGGTLVSGSANLIFDGGNQNINSPAFEINNVTISGTGTKRLFSDWTINSDLLVNAGTYLNTSDNVIPTYYDIYIKGHWTCNGTFVDNTAKVFFDGASSPINISSGGYNFYDVEFSPTASVEYLLQSPTTRFAREMTIGANAHLRLNSNALILGSNIAAGKVYSVDGILSVNENAFLNFNNQNSQSVMNVGGVLNLVGTSSSNLATVSREVAGVAGNETQINILPGGTLAARYYLIEFLQDAGLNLQAGSTLDPTNNFSDGTWSNIRNAANVRYLTLEANYAGGVISNITFNYSGTAVQGTHYNVLRETAATDIVFDIVGGNLGSYKFEDDEEVIPSPTTGKLRWPPVTETNWTGAINTNWHLAGNWDNGIPTPTIDAIIPDRPNDPVITDMDADCKNLNIVDGTVILDNNRNITATGDVFIGTGTSVGILSVNTSNSIITVGGNWTRGTNGIFLHGDGTVIMNSGAGSATILSRASDFFNLVFDNGLTTFYLSGASINFKGKFEILSGTVSPGTNNYNYYIEGNIAMDGGTFTPTQGGVTAGTINLTGSADQDVSSGVFHHLIVGGSGDKNLIGSATINGNTVIQTNLIVNAGCNVDFNGNVTIENTGTFNDGDETHTFTGINWTDNGTYLGNGTIIFDRTNSNQNLYRAHFNNLIVECITRRLYLRDSVTISGDMTIVDGINGLDLQENIITHITGTGSFIMEDNTRTFVYGADNFPRNFGIYDIAESSIVYYYGSSSQSISGVSYGNLYLNNVNTKTLSGDVEVKRNLIFNSSTLDVSINNYTLTVGGAWNNNAGNFICRSGEVIFNGSSNQGIAFGGMNLNEFYDIRVNKLSSYVSANNNTTNDFIIQNNLIVTSGEFNANGRIIYLSGDMLATGTGSFRNNTGTYYLNKTSGTVLIGVNGSSLLNLTINSSGGATVIAQDDITLIGDLNLLSGTFNGNGMDVALGNGNSDVVNIIGTYQVGPGGAMAIGNGTTVTVDASATIEIIGNTSGIARVTNNTSGGRYNFIVNGNISARNYMFEYMTNGGIYLSSTSVIDAVNNFSEGTFTRGANSGQLLRIENNQTFVDPNYIENVSFPVNPGGSASNVSKITSTTGDVEFYNSTGIFAGENYDNDPSNIIHWTGPIELTWNGSVSTDWTDSLNWTASYGPPIVPTGAENVIIAPATNQPILIDFGAKALNLRINNGASITFNTPADAGQSDLDIGGDLTINGSIVLLTTNDNINVEGSWTRGTAGTAIINGNVTFDGSGGAKVIDNRGIPFHNLTIAGTSQYQLGRSTVVNNDITVNAGSSFDVTSANYQLTVKGNWLNNGTFYSHSGKVTFNASSGSKSIRGGASQFNDIDINAGGITYTLDGNLSLKRNLNIISGTLAMDGNTLYMGDNSGTDNLTVTGTLLIDENAIISMGSSARLNANSGSTVSLLGTNASNRARITSQSGGRYSFDINSGATFHARFYEVEYTDGDGIYVHNGANVDLVNNLSDGIFSNGYPGSGTYLRLEHEPGANDTIRNVTFNAGSAFNVSRTVGTSVFFFLDATGAMGTYEFENDIFPADPGTGLIHWPFLNTYFWTGAIDSDWHKLGNWSGGLVPDITKSAIIPASASNFPLISAAAVAKSLTIKTDAKITIANDFELAEDILYSDSVITVGTPTITIGKTWISDGGTFIPANSTVIFITTTPTENIVTEGSAFYNLEINASSGAYSFAGAQVILNDLTITDGSLDVNGYDISIGGSLLNSGIFIVGTRTITFNGTSGNHTINSGGTSLYNLVINSSTGSASYLLASNISVSNNFTITEGIFDLSPDGGSTSYNLTIGNRHVNTNGTLLGRAGNIEVGENWVYGGAAIFTCGTSSVTFVASSGIKTVNPRNNPFYNIICNGNATFRLSSNLLVLNDLSILNGTLDVALAPSYNISISGNWTNNSAFLTRNGTVSFIGTNQSLSSTVAESYYNLIVNASQLTLNNDCGVSNTFSLLAGNIITNSNTLILGTGIANVGTLNYTSGSISGKFERWVNAIETDYEFPIGTSSNTNLLVARFVAGFSAGSLVSEFSTTAPGTSGLPLSDGGLAVDNTFDEGYWRLIAQNSLAATNYNIRLDAQGFVSHPINSLTRIIRRTSGGNWLVDGVHVNPSGNICYRNTLNAISAVSTDFCLGVSTCIGGTIGDADNICEGVDLNPFINYVAPTGGSGYTYTWQETDVLTAVPGDVNWTNIPSSNSLTFDYGVVSDSILVVRQAVATGCPTTYSNTILIEVIPNPDTGPIMHIKNDWAN